MEEVESIGDGMSDEGASPRKFAPTTVNQLRARRQACQLSQAELAALADVGQSTVKALESNRGSLTRRTASQLERALGLAVSGGYALRASDPRSYIRPVLPPRAVRAVADAILPELMAEDDPGGRDAWRLRVEWHTLVDGLAADPPTVPDGFAYLHARMRAELPPERMAEFDADLRERLGRPVEFAQSGVRDELRQVIDVDTIGKLLELIEAKRAGLAMPEPVAPEVQAVILSGLPGSAQAVLLDFAQRRRAEVEASLLAEVTAMVEAVRRAGGK